MKEMRIIAVDFDGTLCRNCYPEIGEPNLKLIAILKNLHEKGCKLILWTCRCGELLEEAVQWCEQFRIPFDAVNENVEENLKKYGTDPRKVFADVYIDDRCCFPWEAENEAEDNIKYSYIL